MPRNSSGTYTLPSGNPVVSGTLIEAGWANTTLSDLGSAMTNSLSRGGEGGMTAALRVVDGTLSVPGIAFVNETSSGLYRAGAGDFRLSVLGTAVAQFLATGVSVTGTFGASGNATVGGTLGVTGATTLTGALTLNGGIANNPVLTAGTANGVTYLNGSKVLTSGTALTFDGTNLTATNGASIQGLTVGRGAGAVSTNTAVGASALGSNTTGADNAAFGRVALAANTTGNENIAIGEYALQLNTTGNVNTALGVAALVSNTTGSSNVALGQRALQANTTASNNTAVGYLALYANTTGTYNTSLGTKAGFALTTATESTFLGNDAGVSQTTGTRATYLGANSGASITTGTKNVILGSYNGNQNSLDIRTASNYIVLSDGDGNPRVIIDNNKNFMVGTTASDPVSSNSIGVVLEGAYGSGKFSRSNNAALDVNRITNDGELVRFYQDGTQEGNISVSGTTVSYNGGHLSRSAQTLTAKDESLVKGTVLSNLDEMNVYTDAAGNPVDNEQLNKVKVSDVEGDANVAGVFVNWSHDEQHNVDEINMAMTGDMIIRIAQGVAVARGDLLMSAGDGTAKPQGDDIVRSKTVAKVTSTYITCTYADGSYCVPCVLMAC